MNIDLLSAGLRMMVLGMGMVYVFLIVMIFAMKIMSKSVEAVCQRTSGGNQTCCQKGCGSL